MLVLATPSSTVHKTKYLDPYHYIRLAQTTSLNNTYFKPVFLGTEAAYTNTYIPAQKNSLSRTHCGSGGKVIEAGVNIRECGSTLYVGLARAVPPNLHTPVEDMFA